MSWIILYSLVLKLSWHFVCYMNSIEPCWNVLSMNAERLHGVDQDVFQIYILTWFSPVLDTCWWPYPFTWWIREKGRFHIDRKNYREQEPSMSGTVGYNSIRTLRNREIRNSGKTRWNRGRMGCMGSVVIENALFDARWGRKICILSVYGVHGYFWNTWLVHGDHLFRTEYW